MLFNNHFSTPNVGRIQAPVVREPNGSQPEFGLVVITLDMHVRRFRPFVAVEEVPKSAIE
jgi:hypothetical protein